MILASSSGNWKEIVALILELLLCLNQIVDWDVAAILDSEPLLFDWWFSECGLIYEWADHFKISIYRFAWPIISYDVLWMGFLMVSDLAIFDPFSIISISDFTNSFLIESFTDLKWRLIIYVASASSLSHWSCWYSHVSCISESAYTVDSSLSMKLNIEVGWSLK